MEWRRPLSGAFRRGRLSCAFRFPSLAAILSTLFGMANTPGNPLIKGHFTRYLYPAGSCTVHPWPSARVWWQRNPWGMASQVWVVIMNEPNGPGPGTESRGTGPEPCPRPDTRCVPDCAALPSSLRPQRGRTDLAVPAGPGRHDRIGHHRVPLHAEGFRHQ